MYKTFLNLFLSLLLSLSISAQISLESTYSHSGIFTRLAVSGTKFYVMDVAANQCRIYNPNHSIWKTINLPVPANHYLYDIRYVSEGLFTTENTLALAYTYYNYDAVNQYYTYTTKLIRENGSELLAIPGCSYVHVYQDENLSAKLLAYVYDYGVFPFTIQTRVYNLPGELVALAESGLSENVSAVVFPNPATMMTTIKYELPATAFNAQLQVHDMNGKLRQHFQLDPGAGHFHLSLGGYPVGTYVWQVVHDKGETLQGKFIVK